MEINRYTTPKLNKGKEVTSIPKGSNKAIEQAKQVWFVSYTFNGKQIKEKRELNRIKDPKEKQDKADALLLSIKNDLKDGYNPLDKEQFNQQYEKENINLNDAIIKFENDFKQYNSNKKTLITYSGKLKDLNKFYPNIKLNDINTAKIEEFVIFKIKDGTYAQGSVSSAKRIFSTCFTSLIKLNLYSHINPIIGFNTKIKSNKIVAPRNLPYTENKLFKLLNYLDSNDKYLAFVCRMIYYTCLRPAEIRQLKLENIDLQKSIITVLPTIKKVNNGKIDRIHIDPDLLIELEKLNLSTYPQDYYLTGSTKNIVGVNKVGESTPLTKLEKAFIKLDKQTKLNPDYNEDDLFIKKGSAVYSFKHTSNIRKYLVGDWNIAQISKGNRHTTIATTEIYLKDRGLIIDLSSLKIPKV